MGQIGVSQDTLHFYKRTCEPAQSATISDPGQSISYRAACASSEDSDQPAHQRRLIWVFSVRLKTLSILGNAQSTLRRLWSDCGCAGWSESSWAHMQSCRKCCAPVQFRNHTEYWKKKIMCLHHAKMRRLVWSFLVVVYAIIRYQAYSLPHASFF